MKIFAALSNKNQNCILNANYFPLSFGILNTRAQLQAESLDRSCPILARGRLPWLLEQKHQEQSSSKQTITLGEFLDVKAVATFALI